MARALIVGCGCRGRLLGQRLLGEGWAVRGTSRREEGLTAIDAAGIEAAAADPARPGTLLELVGDVTVVHWLFGSARGDRDDVASIHGPSLEHFLELLVETPVRGFVYEAAGSVDASLLELGAAAVRAAGERWRIPFELVAVDPAEPSVWVEAALGASLNLASPVG